MSVRMYPNLRPQPGDIVMCKVTDVGDFGSYVELLEFGNIQGMIGLTEYSSKRIRNLSKFLNVGKILPAEVLRVDDNYIDLSKKTLKDTGEFSETNQAWDKYEKSKKVHNIVRRCATQLFPDLELAKAMLNVYETWIWKLPLTNNHLEPTLQAFGRGKMELDLPLQIKTVCELIYKSKVYHMSGSLDLFCLHPDGIEVIKKILQQTKANFTNVKIYYGGHSSGQYTEYIFQLTTNDEIEGQELLTNAMQFALTELLAVQGGAGKICKEVKMTEEVSKEQAQMRQQESDSQDTEEEDEWS